MIAPRIDRRPHGVPGADRVGCALALIAVLGAPPFMPHRAMAQRGPASAVLHGTVIEAVTGVPLGGAEVLLAGPTVASLRSDEGGRWRAADLTPGRYTVRARRMGYASRAMVVDLRSGDDVERRFALGTSPLALDQVVVTAARREQRLTDVAVTTEVISRRDIEQTGASDLAAVLTEQVGIELQGGHPAGTGIMLQGLGSERVLVLLDGQPIAGRISGVFDVSRIPTAVIERVEVVKGPQSTLYGSEAMGGIVNIVTRTPRLHTLGVSGALAAGTQARLDGTAGVAAGWGAWASAFDASRRETALTPGQGSRDGALAARTDVAAKLRWTPDSVRSIEATVLALDERQRWRSGSYYNFGDNTQWSARLGGAWRHGRHRLAPTLYASVFDHLSRTSSERNPIAGDTGQRQLQRLFKAELLYNAQLGARGAQALTLGLEARRDDTRSVRVPGGLRALMTAEPFAQIELQAAAFSVVPGVRMSRSEQWGTHVAPRLALRYRASEALTLRASAGSGYRAPDFKELYMFFVNQSVGYAVQGNPDLHPESSRNLTAGAEWAGERAYVRGQVFQNTFRDFIETRPISAPGAPPVYRFENVENGWTRGAEIESGVTLGRWRAEGGYSRLATRDRATGQSLLGRPALGGRVGGGYALPAGFRASATAIYTGRTPMQRAVADGATTSWRDAFLRADLRVAQRLPGGLELAAGADNVFDRRPAEWAGFTGRHLYTTLSWTAERTRAPEHP